MTEHVRTAPASTDRECTRSATDEAGRQITYTEYGPSDGTPVVCFHGTPGSRRLGALFADDAHRAGVRLLAVDRPGFGQSSPWPSRTLEDTGAFVEPVLDDAGVSTAGFVGFSGGGPHALAAAATLGDRVRTVDVVAGSTPPSLRRDAPAVQRVLTTLAAHLPTALAALFGVQAWVAGRLDPSFVVSQYTADADAVPDDAAAVVKQDFLEAFHEHRRGAVREFRLLERPWLSLVDGVDCPVGLWHGDADANVPIAGVRKLADRLPESRLTVFEGADHLRTLLRARSPVLDSYR